MDDTSRMVEQRQHTIIEAERRVGYQSDMTIAGGSVRVPEVWRWRLIQWDSHLCGSLFVRDKTSCGSCSESASCR